VTEYVYVNAEDFEAVYQDGKLILQDNSLEVHELIKLLGWQRIDVSYDLMDEIYKSGTFPLDLNDIKGY